MKQMLMGLVLGVVIGLTCSACSIAKEFVKVEPLTIVPTERNFINTTKITTEEGTYRIFTIESTRNGSGGAGITAVKID